MLTTIRTANPDATIICLYGMMGMDSRIYSGISSAITQMSDSKIIYNPISISANNSGANGHPTAAAQEGWANQLVTYINGLNL